MELIVNARIKDEFLGSGKIAKIIKGTSGKVFAYMILYDKTPPKDYNGGSNPCLRWANDLITI